MNKKVKTTLLSIDINLKTMQVHTRHFTNNFNSRTSLTPGIYLEILLYSKNYLEFENINYDKI